MRANKNNLVTRIFLSNQILKLTATPKFYLDILMILLSLAPPPLLLQWRKGSTAELLIKRPQESTEEPIQDDQASEQAKLQGQIARLLIENLLPLNEFLTPNEEAIVDEDSDIFATILSSTVLRQRQRRRRPI